MALCSTLHLSTMGATVTVIKAVCLMCGDVTLKPWEVTVMLEPLRDDGEYVFEHCGVPTVRYADQTIIALLEACGCEITTRQALHPSIRNTIRDLRQKYLLSAFEEWLDKVQTVADMEDSLDY